MLGGLILSVFMVVLPVVAICYGIVAAAHWVTRLFTE